MSAFVSTEGLSIFIQIFVLIVNFRTPVVVEGVNSLELKHVVKHYYRNGLLLDLFAALPLNLILGYLQLESTSIIPFALLRVTRMVGFLHLLALFEKLQFNFKNYSILIVSFRAVLFLMLLWHWTSCAWYFVNQVEYNLYDNTWIKMFKVNEKLPSEQYLLSVYYVIKIVTGVGQGDMIAYNNLERISFMFIINIGDALFAIAVGMIA